MVPVYIPIEQVKVYFPGLLGVNVKDLESVESRKVLIPNSLNTKERAQE